MQILSPASDFQIDLVRQSIWKLKVTIRVRISCSCIGGLVRTSRTARPSSGKHLEWIDFL
jgi:hypothetical protein